MGLLWLSTVPPTNGIIALIFGTRWLATLAGLAFFSHQVGGFLGVWLGGVVVVRRFPMIPGIDLAGTVETSNHPDWKSGDKVILNGWGLGETHLGAYGEKARVKGNWLVQLPSRMSAHDAMAIGTAGYTAMLSF